MQTTFPKLLTMLEVCGILGRCRASIYLDVKAGRLPRPLRIGGAIRWKDSDIHSALDRLTAKRDAVGSERDDLVGVEAA